MPILMFISILVFRPEGQIWNPVRRDTRIYVRRILNAFRIDKTQLNSSTISPSYKENVRFSTVDFHKLKCLENETFSKRGRNLRGSIFAEFMHF